MSGKIIGLIGLAGSGKDYAANIIHQQFGYEQCAFADALKEAAQAIFGFSHKQLHTQEGKETVDDFWGFTPRWALQNMGTELFRECFGHLILKEFPTQIGQKAYQRDSIWVRSFERRWRNRKQPNIVISDVRFMNEVEFVRNNGGFCLHIQDRVYTVNGRDNAHASEALSYQIGQWAIFKRQSEGIATTIMNRKDASFEESLLKALEDIFYNDNNNKANFWKYGDL